MWPGTREYRAALFRTCSAVLARSLRRPRCGSSRPSRSCSSGRTPGRGPAGLKLLMLTDDDGETAIRDVVTGSLVDGVMSMEVQRRDPRVPLLSSLVCPAVLVGTPDEALRLPY